MGILGELTLGQNCSNKIVTIEHFTCSLFKIIITITAGRKESNTGLQGSRVYYCRILLTPWTVYKFKTHYKWYCKVYFERLAEAVGGITFLPCWWKRCWHKVMMAGLKKTAWLDHRLSIGPSWKQHGYGTLSMFFFKFQQNDIYSKYC